MEMVDGTFAMRITGLFDFVEHPWRLILNLLHPYGYFLAFDLLPIPFYYRYQVICHDYRLSHKHLLLLFLSGGFISILVLIGVVLAFSTDEGVTPIFMLEDTRETFSYITSDLVILKLENVNFYFRAITG